MIFYTDKFIPDKFLGYTCGPVSLIRPSSIGDYGLHVHEAAHRQQWAKRPFMHCLLYKFSLSYKLECETRAYRDQLKVDPGNELPFAEALSKNYGFDMTIVDALRMLKLDN